MTAQPQIFEDQYPSPVDSKRYDVLTTSLSGAEPLSMDRGDVEQLVAKQKHLDLQGLE